MRHVLPGAVSKQGSWPARGRRSVARAGTARPSVRFARHSPLPRPKPRSRRQVIGVAVAASNLAVLYKYTALGSTLRRGSTAEPCPSSRMPMAPTTPRRPASRHNLGGLRALPRPLCRRQGACPAAGMEIEARALGAGHPAVAADAAALGSILDALGRDDEARELFCRALAVFEALWGPKHLHEIAVNANKLAAIEYRRGRHAEADALWRCALAIKEKTLGRAHPEVATTLTNLGVLAFAQGRPGEAEALWRRSLGDPRTARRRRPSRPPRRRNESGHADRVATQRREHDMRNSKLAGASSRGDRDVRVDSTARRGGNSAAHEGRLQRWRLAERRRHRLLESGRLREGVESRCRRRGPRRDRAHREPQRNRAHHQPPRVSAALVASGTLAA